MSSGEKPLVQLIGIGKRYGTGRLHLMRSITWT